VRRVEARTGHTFGARSAQALMDLGATVCLARVPRCGGCPLAERCPSRGRHYEPLRKQPPFPGSFRQRRADALRTILAGGTPDDGEAVEALARDGFVHVDGDVVTVPA
jgi:A/G-specific adenine glycosylase